jgi:hypothetical protein
MRYIFYPRTEDFEGELASVNKEVCYSVNSIPTVNKLSAFAPEAPVPTKEDLVSFGKFF